MKAFHSNPKVKAKYLRRVQAHFKADEIVKGIYWEGGKGCAVGCTIHSSNHKSYEDELGIPEWLAILEDRIFERLPNERAKLWPAEFLKAIKPGANLNKVKNPFLIFVMESNLESLDKCVYNEKENPKVKKAIELTCSAINQTIAILKLKKSSDIAESSADSVADSAAYNAVMGADDSAASAAYNAAMSAADSVADSAAYNAAMSAADSAASAADSAASAASAADSAADSAARSAASAARNATRSAADSAARSAARNATRSAASAAESAACKNFADKLLKLLRACK